MEKDLFEIYLEEYEKPFSGWDFSYISQTGRIDSFPLPWSYCSKIISRIRRVNSLLDMGTGGGEFLSMLQPLPDFTCATEGYTPNIALAGKKLEPLGVQVFPVSEDDNLPFANETFGLVINRHESYSETEVLRILKHDGVFITQQVGGKDNLDLNKALGAPEDFGYLHWNLEYAVENLKRAGFLIIEAKEDFPLNRFYDLGALLYYLKAVPWQIEGFNISRFKKELSLLHRKMGENGFIDFTGHRFLIEAQKKPG